MENDKFNIQPLFYGIKGPEVLIERIPLYEVFGSLGDYMNIIDRTYLTLSGKNRLTKKERENYKIIAYRFNPGSLNIDIAIEFIDIVQLTFPFLMPAGAIGLWETAKKTYDYVKTLLTLWSDGKTPNIVQNVNIENMVNFTDSEINVHPTLVKNADRIEDSVRSITGFIKQGSVEEISLTDKKNEGIIIRQEEKDLFNPETVIDENPEEVIVDIFRLDKELKRGKLHIIEGLEPKNISFQIVGDQSITPYIDALKSNTKVRVLKELATNLSGQQYVARLQLIGLPEEESDQGTII